MQVNSIKYDGFVKLFMGWGDAWLKHSTNFTGVTGVTGEMIPLAFKCFLKSEPFSFSALIILLKPYWLVESETATAHNDFGMGSLLPRETRQ